MTLLLVVALAGCGSPKGTSDSGYTPPVPRGQEHDAPRTVAPLALTAMQENNDVLTVNTNFEESGAAVLLRVEGQRYELSSRDGTSYTFSNVKVPKLGLNNAKLVVGASYEELPFQITRTIVTLDEWRKYAEPFDFKRINKNPDRYAGTFVKGRGKIYQIQEDDASTRGGLYVTNKGYGFWDDNVRFTLPRVTELVEGDVVSFYGIVDGSYFYETEAGWNVTVPMLTLSYLER